MDWTSCFIKSINYIEEHLLEEITVEDIAGISYISPFYFQKAFNIYTGYTVSEYIRNRRLYNAALEIYSNDVKIIDIAYKYGYETPEAFTKAFVRFHGISPNKIKENQNMIKVFLPLRIHIKVTGGDQMDYTIEKEDKFVIIGFTKTIKAGEGYEECPSFWDNVIGKYLNGKNEEIKKVIRDNNVGEFAVCIENAEHKEFKYIIGGKYKGGNVPQEMELIEIPSTLWAKFRCVGPLPAALQTVNTKIWEDWIPNNNEYELNYPMDVEWYSDGDTNSSDYESAIWLPIKRK